MAAYEEAIRATSTRWAPWYVIPADHKWVARSIVSHAVVRAVENLDLKYPKVEPDQLDAIKAARKQLEDEGKDKDQSKD
jgi:hypothetical protein